MRNLKIIKRLTAVILTAICTFGICINNADMVQAQTMEEFFKESGTEYYASKDEAYAAAQNYIATTFPVMNDHMIESRQQFCYEGEPDDKFLQLSNEKSEGIYSSLYDATVAVTCKFCNSFESQGKTYTSYVIAVFFTSANQGHENLTLEKYRQGEAKAKEIAAQLNSGTDYEKALKAYNYITENITYDKACQTGSIYSALIENCTVCLGFAHSFLAICRNMGLEVYVCSITNEPYAGHAFNIINLDGQYYIADCTGDNTASEGSYRYCFIGTDDFTESSYKLLRHDKTFGFQIAEKSYNPAILVSGGPVTGNVANSNVISEPVISEPVITETIPDITGSEQPDETISPADETTENDTQTATENSSSQTIKNTVTKTDETDKNTVRNSTEQKSSKNVVITVIIIIVIFLIICAVIILLVVKKKKVSEENHNE